MGLSIPSAGSSSGPALPGAFMSMSVSGTERLASRFAMIREKIKRSRTTGVDRCGRYLYTKKRNDCKAGLYSGKEVAPNTWRYGWEYLGGPAKYEFTGSVLDAHELGKRVNANVDIIEVSLNPSKSPHAAMIHGRISEGEGSSGIFYSPMMKKMIQTRPWMKAQEEELRECVKIVMTTYKGT